MASLICVLCFAKLEKKYDINLVNGRRAVDIAAELDDLSFVVQPVSIVICRPCLSLNLNAKLFNDYLHKARENGIAVKIKYSAKHVLSSHESETSETTTERSSVPLIINSKIKTNRLALDFNSTTLFVYPKENVISKTYQHATIATFTS